MKRKSMANEIISYQKRANDQVQITIELDQIWIQSRILNA